jgi:hypothetical protein
MGRYFHGTSAENGEEILMHGFNTSKKTWNESEDGIVYFWNVTDTRNENECIDDARCSAYKTAAVHDSKRTSVIVIEIDGDLETYDDTSCDIAPWEKRTCIQASILNKLINEKKLNIIVHSFIYYPEARAKYLYNQYHNCCGVRWSSIEGNIVNKDQLVTDLKELEKTYPYEYYFKEELK